MGDLFAFEHSGHTRATAKEAFDALADAPEWAKWGKPFVTQAKFAKTASPDPRGVGAVRACGSGLVQLKEETTVYEPDSEFGYRLLTPSPMREYRGHVTLTPNPTGGTDLRWRGEFQELVPLSGPLVRIGLSKMISTFMKNLVRHLDAKA